MTLARVLPLPVRPLSVAFVVLAAWIAGASPALAQFDQAALFDTHRSPTSVTTVDVDGDGDRDVAASYSAENGVSWFENDGTSTFTEHAIQTPTYSAAEDIAAADLDGDGDVDLLASDEEAVVWYENDGGEGFVQRSITARSENGTVRHVSVADVDGDGDPDVLSGATDPNRPLEWHENDGTGTFTTHALPAPVQESTSADLVDLDADGDLDVIATSSGDRTAWYENDGTASFTRHTAGLTSGLESVRAGDVDGDGDLDLVAGGHQALVWYDNDGTEAFHERVFPVTISGPLGLGRIQEVRVRDVNGDGDSDVVTAAGGIDSFSNPIPSRIVWYEGDGTPLDGGWTPRVASRRLEEPSGLHLVDVERDGDLDIFSASIDDDRIAWHENDGAESFATRALSTGPSQAQDVALADVNGDGTVDLLSASSADDKIAWYEGDGTGGLTPHTVTLDAPGAAAVDAADLNGDGRTDVLTAEADTNRVAWYAQQAGGGFADRVVLSGAIGRAADVHAADLDADGDVDALAAGPGDNAVYWFENQGGGAFAAPVRVNVEAEPAGGVQAVTTADLTGSGVPDVIAATPGSDAVVWYANQGNGSFSRERDLTPSLSIDPRSVAAADLDGDADLDVLYGWRSSTDTDGVGWFENQGGGTFAAADTISVNGGGAAVATANLDGDQDVDVVSTGGGNPGRLSAFLNEGSGTFSPVPLRTFERPGRGVAVADGTADGRPDVAVAAGDRVALFTNRIPSLAIASVRPRRAAPGTPLRIVGKGFDPTASNNTVTVGGVTAPVDSAGPRGVYARVPSGVAGPVSVSVTTAGVTATAPRLVVAASSGGTVFTPVNAGRTPGGASDWGDANGDGRLDLGGAPTVVLNQGNGTFAGGASLPEGGDWVDLDADGDLDLFSVETTTLYENRGDGTFRTQPVTLRGDFATDVQGNRVAYGDLDGDGDLDLAVGRSSETQLYRNAGDGAFVRMNTTRTGSPVEDAWADADGDGDLDLLLAESFSLTLYMQQDDGTFVEAAAGLADVQDANAAWADADADGDLDLAVIGRVSCGSGCTTAATTIYQNAGDGTFSSAGAGLPGVRSGTLSWGDADGDGDPDLVVSGRDDAADPATLLIRNDGGGAFTALGPSETQLPHDATRPTWGDLEGDGDLDLTMQRSGTTVLFRNGSSAFALPGIPTQVTATPANTGIRVSWTGVASADRYRIYRSTAPIDSVQGRGVEVPIDTVTAGTTAAADPEADVGTQYHYRVTAVNADGQESPFSREASTRAAGPQASTLTVTTDAGDTGSVTLGVDPEATAGRDPALGEVEQPPLPPSDVFDARLVDADVGATGLGEGVLVDLRRGSAAFRGSKTYELQVQPGSAGSVTVSWTLPFDVVGQLEDAATGGGDISRRMDGADDVTLSVSGRTRFLVTLEYNVPETSETRTVTADGAVDFGSTGTALQFSGVQGTGDVTVERFDYGPQDARGIAESNVSDYRVVIEASETLGFSSATVRLAVDAFGGINDPSQVVLYKRDDPGSGSFTALTPTNVDDNGTADVSDDTLYATTSSFSEFVLASDTEPLPVELAALEARLDGEAAVISWRTASETNNAGFAVQRRGEARQGWTTVGRVTGAGTTSEPQAYTFTDRSLPYTATRPQYRLKQTDTDGTTQVSKPVSVRRTVDAVTLKATAPNPARRRTTVRYSIPDRQGVTIRVFDVLGREVQTLVRREQSGRHQQTLDVSGLASGVYFLHLEADDTVRTQRFTVVK